MTWKPAELAPGDEEPSSTHDRGKGYSNPAYAETLVDLGNPIRLDRSGGSLLKRTIPGSGLSDAVGPYPIFACSGWASLEADLADLEGQFVTVCLVTDPLGDWTFENLRLAFPDHLEAFKNHYVVDLSGDPLSSVTKHHRRNIRRAQRELRVEQVVDAAGFLGEWLELYQSLIARHAVTGAAAFSKKSFALQLALDDVVVFRAVHGDVTVGATLWMTGSQAAYYHLGAYSDMGYELGASFALFAHALSFFAGHDLAWASLGAGAGLDGDATDGLTRFKQGWATETRTAFICGRVLYESGYAELTTRVADAPVKFFPPYRAGSPK